LSQEVNVVKGIKTGWRAYSRMVTLADYPKALACWKDTLAVGFWSGDIAILSAITGSQAAVLSEHAEGCWVTSLAFLPDGTSLVSGCHDRTVKLWDVQTGGVIKTFHGHSDEVWSVSTSSDHTMIASGSRDRTIRFWDIQTGECHCVIEQQGKVHHVAFSPADPQHLMSISGDGVQRWDINGHQVGPAYDVSHAENEGSDVGSVGTEASDDGLSSNGTYFISCQGYVAIVQDFGTGDIVAKLLAPNNSPNASFTCSCFSPNGRLVAVATNDTIYIWDITGLDPLLVETFIGSEEITHIIFSSPNTLISASPHQSVKFWQMGDLSTTPAAGDPKSTQPIPDPIRSISLQAENGIAISSDMGGMVRVWDISTGLCKASFQTPARNCHWRDIPAVAKSRDTWLICQQRDAQMIDGRLIFVWIGQEGAHIWDTDEGKLLQMVDVDCINTRDVRISGDGSKVFCLGREHLQAWSIWTGEAAGKVEVGMYSHLDPFHTDGSRIWVYLKNRPVQGWDFGVSGSFPVLLSNTSSERPHLDFIGSIFLWARDTPRIKDMVTGKVVFQLSGRYAKPVDVQWDGHYMAAGYESGEVLILDFKHLCPE
jgi:WD40 repeat protein